MKLFQVFAFLALLGSLGWTDSVAKTKPAVLTLKDFPLGVGSQWVYARVDSSSSGIFPEGVTKQVVKDTVTVKVVGQIQMASGHLAGIWVREFKSKMDTQKYISLIGAERPKFRDSLYKTDTCLQQTLIASNIFAADTQYVTTIEDTVIFSRRTRAHTDTTEPIYAQELYRFVFPLRVDNTWKSAYPDDSFIVSHQESIEVIQNVFRPGVLVERSNWIPNSYGETAYWIVSGIGLARWENRYEFSFGHVNGVERWRLIRYEIKK